MESTNTYQDPDIALVEEYRKSEDNIYLEMLIEKYNPYICKLTNEMFRSYGEKYSKQDIKQEIILSFINIITYKFDTNNGVKFITYAYKTLRFDALKFVRDDRFYPASERTQRLKNFQLVTGFLDIPVPNLDEDLSELERMDKFMLKESSNEIDDDVLFNVVLHSMDELLTPKQKQILLDYFVNDRIQTDIAREHNTQQCLISQNITRSINILKDYWNK